MYSHIHDDKDNRTQHCFGPKIKFIPVFTFM